MTFVFLVKSLYAGRQVWHEDFISNLEGKIARKALQTA
jgi:hypothetical protein